MKYTLKFIFLCSLFSFFLLIPSLELKAQVLIDPLCTSQASNYPSGSCGINISNNGTAYNGSYSCSSPSQCVPVNVQTPSGFKSCFKCKCGTVTKQGHLLSAVAPLSNELISNVAPGQGAICGPYFNGNSCNITLIGGDTTLCNESDGTTTLSSGEADYTVSITPAINSISQGDTAVYTVLITPDSGMAGNSVTLTLRTGDCPQGAVCSFVGGYTSGGIPKVSVTFSALEAIPQTKTFTITTSGTTYAPNTYNFRIDSDVLLAVGPTATAQLAVSTGGGTNNATCSSFSAPNSIQAGQTFTGTFTMLNSGTKNWVNGGFVSGSSYLISKNPDWNTTWGSSNGLPLPSTPITPGSSTSFSATFTAPNTPGTYDYTFRMGELGWGFYGGQCSKSITVTSTPPPAGNTPDMYIDVPASGATVSGTATIAGWAIDNKASSESTISAVRVYLDGTLLGTASVTNRQDVCNVWNRPGCPNVGWSYAWNTTGATNGSHTIRVDATDSDATPRTASLSIPVTVSNAVTPAPTVSLSATPSSVTSGSSSTLSWTVANATSCTNTGTDNVPNANWTSGTTGSVSSGALTASKSYRLSCTGAGGTTLSNIQTVTVSATAINDAVCSSVTLPSSVTPGQSFTGSMTFLNNGSKTWVSGNHGIYNKDQWSSPAYTWGADFIGIPSNVAPGASYTFSRTFTAPNTLGTYNFRYQFADWSDTGWFGQTCSQSIQVANTPTTSGTLTPSAPTCTIASGASSCTVNLTWNTVNPVGTSAITAAGMTNVNANSGSQAFTVPYSSRIFYLYNNAVLLGQSNATASCISGTTWNGTICANNNPYASCTWVNCASEGRTCSFSGTKDIRYGAGSSYNYGSHTTSVQCTNAVFGDPIVGTAKHCDVCNTGTTAPPTMLISAQNTVETGQNFNISCDAGSTVGTLSINNSCVFQNWSGTTANFLCPSGSTLGNRTYTCSGSGFTNYSPQPSPASVTVSVVAPSYTLTINQSRGGVVTSSDSNISCPNQCGPVSYTPGQTVTLSAAANPLWKFIGWSGACSGIGSCAVTMNSNKTVGALFIPKPLDYREF